jgi:hypothetical protein
MSLFDSMRLPRWQHKNADVRLQAISEIDDQDTLLELVSNDPEPAVQSAALARIADPVVLEALIDKKLAASLQSQAKLQRLHQLLPQYADLPAEIATISDEPTLLHIIRLCDELELITAAMDRITSDETRAELARQHPLAKARLHAAQSIGNLQVLNQLMQQSKGHDKAVFRHCKSVLDEAHARDRQAAGQQEKIGQLMVRMKDLSQSVDSPGYEGQYRSLVMQWLEVEVAATSEQKAAFLKDQAICAQRLIELKENQIEAERHEAEQTAARGELSAILTEFDADLAGQSAIWNAAEDALKDATFLQQVNDAIVTFENRWRAAKQVSAAPAEQAHAFNARVRNWREVVSRIEGLLANQSKAQALLVAAESPDVKNHAALSQQISELKQFLIRFSWPETSPLKAPEILARLQQTLEDLGKHQRALDQDQQKLAARCKELTAALKFALEQQQPGEADRSLAKLRKLLISLAPQRKLQVEQELAPLTAQLKEFHDWQNFAIEPKKEDLVARMSALIGSHEDIELLALNIESLQKEWKQLGPLPQAREKKLWTQFKAAADEAWKPCKEEFARQAEIRRQHFSERMKLIEQLQEYETKMAWPDQAPVSGENNATVPGPSPDWQKVQSTLDAARATFRNLEPVDPKAERTSQKAFREICDRIYSHIHAEYQRNIGRKESLVSRAAALAEQTDLHKAVDAVKQLQLEWKSSGMTPVAADRKLWKVFRSSCDAVFVRLDQQREAQKSETESQVQQAESLRDQARELLRSPDPNALGQLLKSVGELRLALNALNIPPPVQQRLSKDFQAMEAQARDLMANARKQQEQSSWTHLKEAMLACSGARPEASTAGGAEASFGELPKGVDGKLLQAFWQLGPASSDDEKSRLACIALEVFGEIESPAEDKAARMSYQLSRLTAGMGSRVTAPDQELLGQINSFIALRPAPHWAERFFSSLERIRR